MRVRGGSLSTRVWVVAALIALQGLIGQVSAATAFATDSHPLQFTVGPLGSSRASGVAVDEATGNIAVTVNDKEEVELFGSEGGPPVGVSDPVIGGLALSVEPAGVAFDNSASSPSRGALYVAGAGFGASKYVLNPATEKYELAESLAPAQGFAEPLGVAVNGAGEVFVSNYGNEESIPSIIVFGPTGTELGRLPTEGTGIEHPSGLAVDPEGNLYVQNYEKTGIFKYEADASGQIPLNTVPTLLVAAESTGVAVDPSTGAIYGALGNKLTEYSPEGLPRQEFGAGSVGSSERLATDAKGQIYVVDTTDERVAVFGATGIPTVTTGGASAIGASEATLEGTLNPDGKPLTDCSFDYVTKAAFESTGFRDLATGGNADCVPAATTIGGDESVHPVEAELTNLVAGTEYVYRLVGEDSSGRNRGAAATLKTAGPPRVAGESVLRVLLTEAEVEAEVDPEGSPTRYRFEYGPSITYGSQTPEEPVGEDQQFHPVKATFMDLQPGTVYHWRVVATNAIGSPVAGADRTFTTFGPGSGEAGCPNDAFRLGRASRLPDCRAYEMVSPIEKNGFDIQALRNVQSDYAELDQSAPDGEALTYTSGQAFGDAAGAPFASQYLARRSSAGWLTSGLAPAQGRSRENPGNRIDLEYRLFTPDLCNGILLNYSEPGLASGAQGDAPNLYEKAICGGGGIRSVSLAPHLQPLNVGGVSADGSCVAYSPTHNTGNAQGGVYETCDGQSRTVDILPDGTESESGSIGTFVGTDPEGALRAASVTNAVSADGARIYWSSNREGPGPLYLRLNSSQEQSQIGVGGECLEPAKACTIPISEAGENATFLLASRDGSAAVYSIGSNLYEFDLGSRTSHLITEHLSPDGVMGGNSAATRIYFASTEPIDGRGVSGGRNLFVVRTASGEPTGFEFVATLPPAGKYDPLSEAPFQRVSRITPDGRFATFASTGSLTGYDNRDVATGERVFEVYRFDADAGGGAGRLDCVSCNPSGARPTGRPLEFRLAPTNQSAAALIPPYATALFGSKDISEDGSRVFFDAYEDLLPEDTNGKADVYEWEAVGAGTCSPSSAGYSPADGGCLDLISSGQSPSDSRFVDAGADGRDVFFATAESLVSQDPGLIDIYDAREGGGFAEPAAPLADCSGSACQNPAPAPAQSNPGSSEFHGPGDQREKHRRKKPHHHRRRAHRHKHRVRPRKHHAHGDRRAHR